jgi:hypothetical protein
MKTNLNLMSQCHKKNFFKSLHSSAHLIEAPCVESFATHIRSPPSFGVASENLWSQIITIMNSGRGNTHLIGN